MKSYCYLLLFFTSLMLGCSSWNVEPKSVKPAPTPTPIPSPTAAFTASSLSCTAPCTLSFTNQSTNATAYQWDFGDGKTSTLTNPSSQYTQAGTFTVKLTAAGAVSSTSTQQTVTIKSSGLTFSWQRLPDFPGSARSDVSVFVIGNKAYMAGGYLGPETPTDELWEFDGTTKIWDQKRSLPRKGAYATGFANPTAATGYLTGLYTDKTAVPGEVLVYDQATDRWTSRPDSRMNRTFCSVCVLGQKAYIGIGETTNGVSPTAQTGLLEYNMTTGVSALIPTTSVGTRLDGLIQPTMLPNATGTKCLIGDGKLRVNGNVTSSGSYFEFDPNATAKVTGKPDKPNAIIGIIKLSGRYFGLTGSNTQIYEYINDSWALLASVQSNTPPIQNGGVGITIGDTFYLGLGGDAKGVRTKEVYSLTLK